MEVQKWLLKNNSDLKGEEYIDDDNTLRVDLYGRKIYLRRLTSGVGVSRIGRKVRGTRIDAPVKEWDI